MTAFPFSALVGQHALREALLACAVDPAVGGVLVRGERGTAKTTAVRGLGPLVGRIVELPIGATADRVLGTLDLDRALSEGASAFKPGLLASADGGVLYVDEVNLLPDHLVDVLLDAAALGRVHVERDGISAAYDARFLLVGTMNPEEGDLRPQLLDRFGLSVEVAGSVEPSSRVEIVRRRLAFDRDPSAFASGWAREERELAERVAAARKRRETVRLPDRIVLLIASTCARLGVDGHRADIVCARAATALAALDGVDEVTTEHVRRAARLALAHRRRRGPLQAPGLDDAELDAALSEAEHDDEPDPSPNGSGPHPGERGSEGHDREPAASGDVAGGRDETDGVDGAAGGRDETDPVDDAAGVRGETGAHNDAGLGDRPYRAGAPAGERLDAPGAAGLAPLLALPGRGRGAEGRRSRATGGPPVDSREPRGEVTDLALAATLRAAATRRALALVTPPSPGDAIAAGPPTVAARFPTPGAARPASAPPPRRASLVRADLREHVRAGREGNLLVFCVDASGSMGARRRMARVKGAILGLLTDAYQRRDRVALVTFRGDQAQLVLPPTASVERGAAALTTVATGGRTPLAAGLAAAEHVIVQDARRERTRRALALVVTDGRASDGAEAVHAAAVKLARAAAGVVVFDGEQGAVRLNLAADLAEAAGARLLPLEALAA